MSTKIRGAAPLAALAGLLATACGGGAGNDRAGSSSSAALVSVSPCPAACAIAPGLRGNYGYLTDFTPTTESAARAVIDEMVDTFGITDVQFYDWFEGYSTPTEGTLWTDPYVHQRWTSLQTIEWYIDELHQRGGRAWAYVQSIASEDPDLANPGLGIYPLLDANGDPIVMGPNWTTGETWPLYFANAAWAQHQVGVWGQAVAALRFDGIHWDTLGRQAGDYGAETAGFQAFLRTAQPLLANLGLLQTMNFVDVSWWDDSLLDVVAFPYAEVWSPDKERLYYATMADPLMQARWGVIAHYPSQDIPVGWTDSETMLARWNEAPKYDLRYLVIGNGDRRLDGPYFPFDDALTAAEAAAMSQ